MKQQELLVVHVSTDLMKAFRKHAVEKYGKIRGVIKPEIDAALRAYLDAQKSTIFQSPQIDSDNSGSGSK
jgi:hypothetical protein